MNSITYVKPLPIYFDWVKSNPYHDIFCELLNELRINLDILKLTIFIIECIRLKLPIIFENALTCMLDNTWPWNIHPIFPVLRICSN